MFRKILALAVLAVSVSTFASTTNVDVKGLSEAQIAEIKAIAAKKVAETAAAQGGGSLNTQDLASSVTFAATWGQQAAMAAEGFAKAMGIAAKELNIAINDFLTTPAGMITAGLVIWKVAGASIAQLFFGLIILAVGLSFVRFLYHRLFTAGFETKEYSHFGGLFRGTKQIRKIKSFSDLKTDGEWFVFCVMIGVAVITLLFSGAFIT